MRDPSTDVLIVGAGPAGLATAIGLAQRGVDFRIIDALPEAQNTSRAAVIHAATLECLDTLKVANSLVAQGIKAPHFRIRDRRSILLHTDFSLLPTPAPFALMIPQDESEQILIDRLSDLGHRVQRPVVLVSVKEVDGRIIATCRCKHGQTTFSSRYLVGADGEKSVVRASKGIGFPGETYGSFMLADVEMEWPISRDEISLFFSEAGTLVVAPMSLDRYRVVAQLPNAPTVPSIDDVQKVIEQRGPKSAAHVRKILWGSRFQVHHRLADRFRDGRTLLVGDAAHVHSPAGGQGMNLGLRDAIALSAALASAIATGREEPLETFSRDRRLAALRVLTMTDRLTKVATLSSPVARWLRNRLITLLARSSAIRGLAASTLAGFR